MRIFCHRGKFGCTDMGLDYLNQPNAKGDTLKNLPPENAEASVKAAFDSGYGVEIDVVMTKDKELLVTHTNNLCNHSKDALPGSFASQMNLADILKMKTGMGGETAPFLTYVRFLEMLAGYKDLTVNVEIKGTIDGDKSLPEPQNPSLVEQLVRQTPDDLFSRIIWSSFALSNLVKMKKLRSDARVAQLFCLAEHDGTKMYPDTDDVYMQLSFENLQKVLGRVPDLEAVHPSIDNLNDEGVLALCANKGIKIRTWVLCERNPSKNEVARDKILNVLKLKKKYPGLEFDFITDFVDEVERIIKS